MPKDTTPRYRRTVDASVFGAIPGIEPGTSWASRQECSNSGVHPGIMAGIYGNKNEGARSVVLSGGYEDDVDNGYSFIYTGCGGRDLGSGPKMKRVGPQAYDQSFDNPKNMALKVSSMTGRPVRVVRGFKLHSDFAPAEGYRYDGLYRVMRAWIDKGKQGHGVCKFEFKRLPNQPPIPRREGTLNLDLPTVASTSQKRTRAPSPNPLRHAKFEGTLPNKPTATPTSRQRRAPSPNPLRSAKFEGTLPEAGPSKPRETAAANATGETITDVEMSHENDPSSR